MLFGDRKTTHTIVVSIGGKKAFSPFIVPIERQYSKGAVIRWEELDGHELKQRIKESDQIYIQAKLKFDFQDRYGMLTKFHYFDTIQDLIRLLHENIPKAGLLC